MDSRAQGENPECMWLFSATGLFLPSEWLWKEPLVCKVPVVRCQPICWRYIWWPRWWPLTRHACPSPQAAASAQRSGSLWSDGVALVVAGQVPSLFGNVLEHIHHEGIHEVHGLLWETQAHVDLLQHPGEIGGEALNVRAATVMAAAAAAAAALWCLLCLPWLRFEGLSFADLSSFIAQVFLRQLRRWLMHFRLTFPTAQRKVQGGFWGLVPGFISPACPDVTARSIYDWIKCKSWRPVALTPHVMCHWMPLPRWPPVDQSQQESLNFLWPPPETLNYVACRKGLPRWR